MFAHLDWRADRLLLNGLVFRLEHKKSADWELGDACFSFYKIKALVDQYERFWATRPGFRAEQVLELGMWDGGSLAFWHELFRPRKLVGVDLADRADSAYFEDFRQGRGLAEQVKTYWATNQADAPRLRAIVAAEFAGPLDLVLDDASHLYGPTKASFECLFPLLRPGALYIIEDWAWAHWQHYQDPQHEWARETAPTQFVTELAEAAGSGLDLIGSLTVYQGFVVVERGPAAAADLGDFRLDRFITRRPAPAAAPPAPQRSSLRRWLGRVKRRLLGPA